MLESMSIFNGIGERMKFLALQQRVVSQNITHADTPGYTAREVKEPTFKKTMARYLDGGAGQKVSVEATNSQHMTKRRSVGKAPDGAESRETYEVSPGENAVVLEEQILKSSEANGNYQLMANLYEKHIDIMRIAMRRS